MALRCCRGGHDRRLISRRLGSVECARNTGSARCVQTDGYATCGFGSITSGAIFAMRSARWRAAPGFTAVAVLSLAIGIGANTAIFTLVNAIVLGDTPVERPERVVNVYLHQAAFAYSSLSYPEVKDLRDGAGEVFTHIGSTQIVPAQVDGQEGVGTLLAEVVSGNYFDMLGVRAVLGRMLLAGDDVARGGLERSALRRRIVRSGHARRGPGRARCERFAGGLPARTTGPAHRPNAGASRGLTASLSVLRSTFLRPGSGL